MQGQTAFPDNSEVDRRQIVVTGKICMLWKVDSIIFMIDFTLYALVY